MPSCPDKKIAQYYPFLFHVTFCILGLSKCVRHTFGSKYSFLFVPDPANDTLAVVFFHGCASFHRIGSAAMLRVIFMAEKKRVAHLDLSWNQVDRAATGEGILFPHVLVLSDRLAGTCAVTR